MNPYLIVTGDFVRTGGMDRANFALASYLARHGHEVHLVAHRVAADLARRENVKVHRVPKPANSYLLGAPLLDFLGRAWAARIAARGGRVVVNGGNCRWGDVNWVHYVHAAWMPESSTSGLRKLKEVVSRRLFLTSERAGLKRARIVITNSSRTRRDVVERIGIPETRVQTIYYGVDPGRFRPLSPADRARAKAALEWSAERPVVAFVGALGDRRKGFDLVLGAWERLCADPRWDADLAVVGVGGELPAWRARAKEAGLGGRIHFMGFRDDVPAVLAACDALVSPPRYDAYGLAAHEALCCGLPAFVTETAGVAERYPPALRRLLIPAREDTEGLAARLRAWRAGIEDYRTLVAPTAEQLRARSWDHMAADILTTIEAA
jgi:glycosyltransferase involved in cell wall biosynthesis